MNIFKSLEIKLYTTNVLVFFRGNIHTLEKIKQRKHSCRVLSRLIDLYLLCYRYLNSAVYSSKYLDSKEITQNVSLNIPLSWGGGGGGGGGGGNLANWPHE